MEHCSKVVIFFLLFICTSFYCGEAKKKKGHIINYASDVTVCADDDSQAFIETSRLKAIRHNETIAVLEGKFEFKKKLENFVRLNCVFEKMTPLGTKEEMVSLELENFCAEVKNKNQQTMIGQYLRAIDFPPECPIAAGEYYIDHMVADTKDVPVNAFAEGVYTMKFTFSTYTLTKYGLTARRTDEKILGCLYFDISVEKL